MPIQEVYGSGVIAKEFDTRRMLLVKRLTSLISKRGTTNQANYPFITDTSYMLRKKIVRVLNGI